MSNIVIQMEGLGKRYQLGGWEPYRTLGERLTRGWRRPGRDEWFWALRELSCEIHQGEVVGIIGHNGAGKSTLLKLLSRITEPTEGWALLHGRVGSLLEVGTGFHPELSGRENIFLNGIILGMTRQEVARRFDEIVAFAEVEKFLDTPVKRYSSGMYVRLAFAVAAHLEPEILIVDEVLSVGDAAFQRKCLGKIGDIAGEGRTVLFVSHNMNAVQRLCSRTLLLEGGRLAASGPTPAMVSRYLTSSIGEVRPGHWLDVSAMPRQGTGVARVVALCYRSPSTVAGGYPYSQGPLDVTLDIVSDQARTVPSVAVTLYDRSGNKLVNADTLALGQSVALQPGHNRVHLRIEQVHLNPGSYTLGWWLGDALNDSYDFVELAIPIEVADLPSQGMAIRLRDDGVVPCRFQILPQPDLTVAGAGSTTRQPRVPLAGSTPRA